MAVICLEHFLKCLAPRLCFSNWSIIALFFPFVQHVLAQIQAKTGNKPDKDSVWCVPWYQRASVPGVNRGRFFPLFPLIMFSPVALPGLFRKIFAFGSFWLSLRCSSHVYCSQRGVSSNQTNALAFLLTRTRLVCSARPCCTPANLCDVIEAGALNASYRGQVWRLYVIDKLQFSLCEEHGEFSLSSAHKTQSSDKIIAFLLVNVRCSLQILSILLWPLDSLVYLKTASQPSLNVTAIPAGCHIKQIPELTAKCHLVQP